MIQPQEPSGEQPRPKAKKGITFGAFDLFHAGHVLMLQEAKTVCDHLIVCIQTDPTLDRPGKNKPIQSIVERQIQVSACKYVVPQSRISSTRSSGRAITARSPRTQMGRCITPGCSSSSATRASAEA